MKAKQTLKPMATASVIAALYVALTLSLPFLSFGAVQCRISEALTVLPALTPIAIPGLAVGCAVANLFGMAASPVGAWDILIGTCATLFAAWASYGLRNVKFKGLPLLSALAPVVFNGLIVGGEIAFLTPGAGIELFVVIMAQVAAGEAVACFALGLPLYVALNRSKALKRFW